MPISGVNPTPRTTAVYASDPALPRRPQDSLPSRLLSFGRTRLALASSYRLLLSHPASGSHLGYDGKALRPSVRAPASVTRFPGSAPGACGAGSRSPWPPPFAPSPPAGPPVLFGDFITTMTRSDLSRPCIIGFGSSPSRCGPDGFSAGGQA